MAAGDLYVTVSFELPDSSYGGVPGPALYEVEPGSSTSNEDGTATYDTTGEQP